MPLPIRKVKDQVESKEIGAQYMGTVDLNSLLPFLNISPYSLMGSSINESDKKALNKIWANSDIIDSGRIKVSADVSQQEISSLRAKGLVKGEENVLEFTEAGKKMLKDTILNDENSSFTKQASKKMISENSFDFGDEVLVKIQHPQKFGARYINISKTSFAKKNIEPKKIDTYKIATTKTGGTVKTLSEYSDNELVQVLHIAKKVIKHASQIAGSTGQTVPVHRIKSFAEMVMEELNRKERG